MFAASYFVGNITYSLFDAGLANVLALQTLRHGTSPINNIGIRIFGGNPNHGFKATGSTKGVHPTDDTSGYFYVFKDSEVFKDPSFSFTETSNPLLKFMINIARIKGLWVRFQPNVHSALSGYNFVASVFPQGKNQLIIVKCLRIFFGVLGGITSLLISPTIRFRFSQIDLARLETDPDYGIAYKTQQKIEPWRIGILGTLLTGINPGWFSRVKAHPRKFITGVIQLGVVAAIVALGISILIANPLLIIPVAVGAALS